MELFAAIDLLGGRARRLEQGDYDRPIQTSAEPLALAEAWLSAGVRRLHLVDLDGARTGQPVNAGMVAAICGLAANFSAQVQVGGGLREVSAVQRILAAGAERVMLGSAAVQEPAFVAECSLRWPTRIGVSLDLRHGRPAIEGWRTETPQDALDLAQELLAAGAACLALTDTERDGTYAGPNLELMAAFRSRYPGAVLLAAGGIASVDDLLALAHLGVDGAIVGRALLEGSLDLAEALSLVNGVPSS